MNDEPLYIFSENCNHPLNQLSLDDKKFFLRMTIRQFRERPLCGGGYNEEDLRFYDGVLGNLIRTRDLYVDKGFPKSKSNFLEFTTNWQYQGDIYRVLGKSCVFRKDRSKPYFRTPAIKWHGMVASWSRSYDFTVNFNHLYPDEDYTIIHANTGDSVGIDVNKFATYLDDLNPYTESEQEIIFPMMKRYVVEIYKRITPRDFKALM